LWNYPVATVLVEGLMFAAGVEIYSRVTRAKDGIGRWGFGVFVIVLAALYIANIFSPPPTDVKPILIVTTPIVWLIIVWAWWADRHRETR
jgi:hypothetical protein